MGTKFRTMLAPIGLSTGDGRRFKSGAIELASVPFPFQWVRESEGGHAGAIAVGAVQEATVATVGYAVENGLIDKASVKGLSNDLEAVWASGELFDGVDREEMPRLAEDVAEAMHLIGAGTLGPSVDLDTFEGVPVMEGTDEPVTWEDIEDAYDETGEEPKIELLITQGRVRAATLVTIPAFAETSRPLELIEQDADELALAASENPDVIGEHAREVLALVASVTSSSLADIADFALPALDGPTPITWDYATGRVFGHIAIWSTCHVGYADVCVTAPRDDEASDYGWFNRYAVETSDGTVWAGRITVDGRHASLSLDATGSMSHHDRMTVAAHVRAYSDAHGIVVAGRIEPGLTGEQVAVLNRRKVSGDWRETPGGLSLIEVLALSPGPRAMSEPGFPVEVPATYSRAGRQVALTAALGPEPGVHTLLPQIDLQAAVRAALAADREDQARLARQQEARAELAMLVRPVIEESRAALAAALGGEEKAGV